MISLSDIAKGKGLSYRSYSKAKKQRSKTQDDDSENASKTQECKGSLQKGYILFKEESIEETLARSTDTDKIFYPIWEKERLQNEAATLQFIASNTTIPVPKCRLYLKDGLLHFERDLIKKGILLRNIDPKLMKKAVQIVDEQINSTILPQLRSFRRNFIGSVDQNIPVFPHLRVYIFDRRSWPRITSETDEFVLCHTNLESQYIYVDPITFEITGITGWEYAGYFPPYFELPFWKAANSFDKKLKMWDEAQARELGFFGLKGSSDLNHTLWMNKEELLKENHQNHHVPI